MKRTLSKEEIQKLSSLLNIESKHLKTLATLGLLHFSEVRNILIKSEYEFLVKNEKQPKVKVMKMLSEKHKTSVSSIELAIYNKQKNKNYKSRKHE